MRRRRCGGGATATPTAAAAVSPLFSRALSIVALSIAILALFASPVHAYTGVTCTLNDAVLASMQVQYAFDTTSQWTIWVNAPSQVMSPPAPLASSSAASLPSSSALAFSSSALSPSSSIVPTNISSSSGNIANSSNAVPASSSAATFSAPPLSSSASVPASSSSSSSSPPVLAASSSAATTPTTPSSSISVPTNASSPSTTARRHILGILADDFIASAFDATPNAQLNFPWLPVTPNTTSSLWSSLIARANGTAPSFSLTYSSWQVFNLTIVSPIATSNFTGFLLYAITESYRSVGTLSGSSQLASVAALPAACQTGGVALTDASSTARSTLSVVYTAPAESTGNVFLLGAVVNSLANTASVLPRVLLSPVTAPATAGPSGTPNITSVMIKDGIVTLTCMYDGDTGTGPIVSFIASISEAPLAVPTNSTPAAAIYIEQPRSFTANVTIAGLNAKQIYIFKVVAVSAYDKSNESDPVTFPVIDVLEPFVPGTSTNPSISALGVLGIVLGFFAAVAVVWLVVRFYRRKGRFDIDVKEIARTITTKAAAKRRSGAGLGGAAAAAEEPLHEDGSVVDDANSVSAGVRPCEPYAPPNMSPTSAALSPSS